MSWGPASDDTCKPKTAGIQGESNGLKGKSEWMSEWERRKDEKMCVVLNSFEGAKWDTLMLQWIARWVILFFGLQVKHFGLGVSTHRADKWKYSWCSKSHWVFNHRHTGKDEWWKWTTGDGRSLCALGSTNALEAFTNTESVWFNAYMFALTLFALPFIWISLKEWPHKHSH